jgi:phosphoribosylformylglycinamidine synthase
VCVSLIVAPRIGTVSPWASKATDIAHNCGLPIRRVERMTEYRLVFDRCLRRAYCRCPTQRACAALLHDRMTESVLVSRDGIPLLFQEKQGVPMEHVDVLGRAARRWKQRTDVRPGAERGRDRLPRERVPIAERNPTDVELMMFAQANSEHCRHKIFNAEFVIDGQPQDHSLFQMIRNTHKARPAAHGRSLTATMRR